MYIFHKLCVHTSYFFFFWGSKPFGCDVVVTYRLTLPLNSRRSPPMPSVTCQPSVRPRGPDGQWAPPSRHIAYFGPRQNLFVRTIRNSTAFEKTEQDPRSPTCPTMSLHVPRTRVAKFLAFSPSIHFSLVRVNSSNAEAQIFATCTPFFSQSFFFFLKSHQVLSFPTFTEQLCFLRSSFFVLRSSSSTRELSDDSEI